MAQLIKLENYISRYEQDPFHYPSQYMRLKQEQWQQLRHAFENPVAPEQIEEPKEPTTFINQWRKRKRDTDEKVVDDEPLRALPQTEEQLKVYYLNQLYQFQLKWASSTITQMSFIDRRYEDDLVLKYLLQRFPDTYLVMYHPIFRLKKAEVEADNIVITPFDIYIIKLVEFSSDIKIIAGDDRQWQKEEKSVRSNFISPLLSLKRTDKIVKSILNYKEVDMPVTKMVLSRSNVIDYHLEPFQTVYIGKDSHEDWVLKQRQLKTPLKHKQLKAIDALLSLSDTVSINRPEWQREDSDQFNWE